LCSIEAVRKRAFFHELKNKTVPNYYYLFYSIIFLCDDTREQHMTMTKTAKTNKLMVALAVSSALMVACFFNPFWIDATYRYKPTTVSASTLPASALRPPFDVSSSEDTSSSSSDYSSKDGWFSNHIKLGSSDSSSLSSASLVSSKWNKYKFWKEGSSSDDSSDDSKWKIWKLGSPNGSDSSFSSDDSKGKFWKLGSSSGDSSDSSDENSSDSEDVEAGFLFW
jgi:hypothetical protein